MNGLGVVAIVFLAGVVLGLLRGPAQPVQVFVTPDAGPEAGASVGCLVYIALAIGLVVALRLLGV